MEIKEIKEGLEFIKGVLVDAVEAKADGDVTTFEMVKIALSNAPAAVSAVMGLDQAILEAKDIDKDEAKELAGLALEIGKLAMQLFAKAA
jgi:hypothetical protein